MTDKTLLIALSAINLASFAWAVKGHFSSTSVPVAMRLVSALSLANFVVFISSIWGKPVDAWPTRTALALNLLALIQFAYAIRHSRGQGLKLLFDEHTPEHVHRGGIYQHVRHPFYGAYIAFWLACAIASPSSISRILSVTLCVMYVVSAFREERTFLRSALSSQYQAYKHNSGMFLPTNPRSWR